MTISFKLSENVKQNVIKFYRDKKRSNTPQYAIFQADDGGSVITLYESGKIVFQGISADIDARLWIDQEKHLNNRVIDINSEKKDKKDKNKDEKKSYIYESTIGSDEVGTGDYFGPIIVTATYVSKENISFLHDLGVKDSKKIDDEKILEIAPKIIKKIPYASYELNNHDYNNLSPENLNMNKIKAILHNKVLLKMQKENYEYSKIVIDQFCYPQKYYEHIMKVPEKVTNIYFTTKAEDICASVAAASIISRYLFLQEIDKMSDKIGFFVPKGASNLVDETAARIVKKYNFDILKDIAKMNFKNTEKIKNIIEKS